MNDKDQFQQPIAPQVPQQPLVPQPIMTQPVMPPAVEPVMPPSQQPMMAPPATDPRLALNPERFAAWRRQAIGFLIAGAVAMVASIYVLFVLQYRASFYLSNPMLYAGICGALAMRRASVAGDKKLVAASWAIVIPAIVLIIAHYVLVVL